MNKKLLYLSHNPESNMADLLSTVTVMKKLFRKKATVSKLSNLKSKNADKMVHKAKVLTAAEVEANRSSAYQYLAL